MYAKWPSIVLGFHGCSHETFINVIEKHQDIKRAQNTYDWFGHGVYFWENSYERALDWARENQKIEQPAVIGAFLDLGNCFNLMDYSASKLLLAGYHSLQDDAVRDKEDMPKNRIDGTNDDLLIRDLDCAVIERLHVMGSSTEEPFDSVRGLFIEGGEAYPEAGFMKKTHTQICIVNPNCIKGYFSPRQVDTNYRIP